MKPFTVIDVPQRSEAWVAARLGRLTGSVASDAFAKTKTGWSTSRRNLMLKLVLERITGKSQDAGFQSAAMLAGIEREPLARAAFESLTGDVVSECGFCQHNELMAGASLDGYLGDFQTVVSIKCRQPSAHLEFLKTGKIPADAFTQMQHELWVTGAERAMYFCWNPDFPKALQARCSDVQRKHAEMASYDAAVREFLSECDREYAAVMELQR